MGAPDSPVRHRTAIVHCPVHATSAQPLGFGAVDNWRCLSSSCTEQSGATPDSPVPFDFCRGTVDHCSFCTESLARRESLLWWLTGQSGEL
jgi:Fe-S-cluster-containing dehydrogenase component